MTGKLIWECPKGRDLLRLDVSDYKGRPVVNFRSWYRSGDDWKPSREGVAFTPERLSELHQALGAHLAACGADGQPGES